MKKLLAILLSCVLLLNMGCAGIIVKRAKEPFEPPIKTKVAEDKVLFVSDVPQGKYPTGRLSKNYAVWQMEDRIKKAGGNWKLFINDKPIAVRNWGGKGTKRKLYTSIIDPGHIFAGRLIKENEDGKLYKVEFIGRCGNDVEGLHVLDSPAVWAITERYRDTDYTPAIWAGIAGILIGMGLGFWIWHGRTILSVVQGSSCASSGCGIGGPAPPPAVP